MFLAVEITLAFIHGEMWVRGGCLLLMGDFFLFSRSYLFVFIFIQSTSTAFVQIHPLSYEPSILLFLLSSSLSVRREAVVNSGGRIHHKYHNHQLMSYSPKHHHLARHRTTPTPTPTPTPSSRRGLERCHVDQTLHSGTLFTVASWKTSHM